MVKDADFTHNLLHPKLPGEKTPGTKSVKSLFCKNENILVLVVISHQYNSLRFGKQMHSHQLIENNKGSYTSKTSDQVSNQKSKYTTSLCTS